MKNSNVLHSEKDIDYRKFESVVAKILNQYPFFKRKRKHIKLCKSLFNKGFTPKDAAGLIIMSN